MATTSSVATSRTPRIAAILTIVAVVAGIVAVALLRKPAPTGPGAGVAPVGVPRAPRRAETSVDVSMIMVIYEQRTVERPGTERPKTEAYRIAKDALARIAGGEPFERVLLDVTDDRDGANDPNPGRPFNRGSYTIAESTPVLPAVKKVAFSTAVGLIHPQPIDAGTAYVILRRDR